MFHFFSSSHSDTGSYPPESCIFTFVLTAASIIGKTIVQCFAGQLSRKVRERHLSLSLYKLTAFVTCSITELNT
jgi:hypothetical protein